MAPKKIHGANVFGQSGCNMMEMVLNNYCDSLRNHDNVVERVSCTALVIAHSTAALVGRRRHTSSMFVGLRKIQRQLQTGSHQSITSGFDTNYRTAGDSVVCYAVWTDAFSILTSNQA